jgi:hypothetical protein
MNRLVFIYITTLVFMLTGSGFVYAHPGGLDKNGGHTDKSTGMYHCHRAGCAIRASQGRVSNRTVTTSPKFNRNEWGTWKDLDDDCQDTRAEVLQRDSAVPVTFTSDKSCAVSRGQWHDPYTGDQFSRALSLDIDHIVPLEWANNHGGAMWTKELKQNFTNELDNLITVGAGVNRDKGAQGPDRWLPPEENFRCLYLARFLHIYDKYSLRFDAAERRDITALATSCDLVIRKD